jgi:hypothetical protein
MAVGAFVNVEIEKRVTMISEKRASDILEKKTNKYLQLNTPPLRSGLSAEIKRSLGQASDLNISICNT